MLYLWNGLSNMPERTCLALQMVKRHSHMQRRVIMSSCLPLHLSCQKNWADYNARFILSLVQWHFFREWIEGLKEKWYRVLGVFVPFSTLAPPPHRPPPPHKQLSSQTSGLLSRSSSLFLGRGETGLVCCGKQGSRIQDQAPLNTQ